MNNTDKLPEICQRCLKSSVVRIHQGCEFCKKTGFHEEILCYLNQSIQNPVDFICNAFQPALKLVTPSKTEEIDIQQEAAQHLHKATIKSFLQSDRFKYKKALAIQKMKNDPGGIYFDIKYHFAWNVIHRRPVFEPKEQLEFISTTFQKCGELISGSVYLIWLAPDHVHVYVDSDGEISAEDIAQEVKRFSEKEIINEPESKPGWVGTENSLWDKAYFVETLG